MGANELIFLTTAVIDLFFVLFMVRLGKEGLIGAIVVNLVLVSSLGGLLVPFFGQTTNVGNVFYAAVFLAALLIAEHYGPKAALKSVWVAFGALVVFVLMGQYTIRLISADNSALDAALKYVFGAVPRVAFASAVAFLIAQSLNIAIFAALKRKTGRRLLWLRALVSSAAGQLVDSVIFFAFAFAGTIPRHVLLQTMLAGLGLKLVVAVLGIPVLYTSYFVRTAGSDGRSEGGPKLGA